MIQARNIDFDTLRAILYNNPSGANDGIVLSESAADFTRLKIYLKKRRNKYDSADVYEPNGKTVSLIAPTSVPSTKQLYVKHTTFYINGTSITKDGYTESLMRSSYNPNVDAVNNIKIVRVEGWNI